MPRERPISDHQSHRILSQNQTVTNDTAALRLNRRLNV